MSGSCAPPPPFPSKDPDARDISRISQRDKMHDTALLQAIPQVLLLRPRKLMRTLGMT